MSAVVVDHNKRLHKALERALELKIKVDDVYTEIMGGEVAISSKNDEFCI